MGTAARAVRADDKAVTVDIGGERRSVLRGDRRRGSASARRDARPRGLPRLRVARDARASRRVRVRVDHDDLSRFLRNASRSPCRCCASTTRRANGRSIAAPRSTGDSAPAAASLIAVVISAGGPHDALDHATLCARRRSAVAAVRARASAPSSGRGSSSRGARRTRARRRSPARRTGASPAASIWPAITPIPNSPPRSKRRPAAASRPLARCSQIAASRCAERAHPSRR